jgi:hypothetical protein
MTKSNHKVVLDAARSLQAVSPAISVSMLSSFTGMANTVIINTIKDLSNAGEPISVDEDKVTISPRRSIRSAA